MAKNRNEAKNGNEVVVSIRETIRDSRMKNISHFSLPHFHGLTSKDPDTLLFEFSIIYITYDYTYDDQNLKLFPSTIKDATFHWFMSLPGDSITT